MRYENKALRKVFERMNSMSPKMNLWVQKVAEEKR